MALLRRLSFPARQRRTWNDGGPPLYLRTAQIRISPATADPMPTTRRILSGVESALFMARRIQAGLAANNNPSSTNRMPTPMRKSANAMDLIGLKPPVSCSFLLARAQRFRFSPRLGPYGFGAAAAAAAGGVGATGGLPEELPKNLKKSESGRSRKRVSLLFRPF